MRKADGPETPPGFFEACRKYEAWDDESAELWQSLERWRRGLDAVSFQERILQAVKNGDFDYVEKLIQAMRSKRAPDPAMNAYRAAIEAFQEIFFADSNRSTREEWPTKQEIRERANEILQAANHPTVSARHWPRVFKAVGLSELPAGGLNRPL